MPSAPASDGARRGNLTDLATSTGRQLHEGGRPNHQGPELGVGPSRFRLPTKFAADMRVVGEVSNASGAFSVRAVLR